ncbi:MmgE/PrpD family protein [Afifella sp. IM 167]|uniref:MmgE/PrpD family protein n=1 Tax=Afifella sp. IM 167 TaxID=2033586 RepID=UPI001CC98738|nr:MmgE/PrpD family protein [Afifella sp. IM 167]MBZ8135146.1 hypothetical protein [Afifella sp. IM 167]
MNVHAGGLQDRAVTKALADFLVGIELENVPRKARDDAAVMVLDLLGCAFGALRTEEARIAAEVFGALGGTAESSAWGLGFRTSCTNAAYLNGLIAHVIELDDTHRPSITHVGAAVVPAAIAIAEREKASGADFLRAIIVGYEACLRIANAVQPDHWRRGFLSMGTCGTFGAAAAAGALLGFDSERMRDALGLAGVQAAGINSSIYGDGDMGKRLCPGHAASAGVLAALLAARGFTGSRNVIEQPKGFCESFSGDYDLSLVTENMGEVWEVSRTSLKPYSCCRYNHAPIDGFLDILAAEDLEPQDIASVVITTYGIAVDGRPHRTRPQSLFDAKMSIPFSLAVAAFKRKVGESDFTEDLVARPDLQAFAERVKVQADDGMTARFPQEWPAHVTVSAADGRSFERLVPFPKGEPEAPMSRAEIEGKFADLSSAALGDSRVDDIIDEINGIEGAASLDRLVALIG